MAAGEVEVAAADEGGFSLEPVVPVVLVAVVVAAVQTKVIITPTEDRGASEAAVAAPVTLTRRVELADNIPVAVRAVSAVVAAQAALGRMGLAAEVRAALARGTGVTVIPAPRRGDAAAVGSAQVARSS
jgi:hypothetical protein